ncbi:MAG TPA: sulfatase-like hydrolase/transferase [Lacipirellulaceae bacterium]|nr:sulfatase-like hydrolase/transferase [Lacipirellulaceae bacterium]
MSGALAATSAQAKADRPNFVVILADDLGFSDLGCYGGEIATPNIDQLAAQGLRYTQFYSTARCWPTRGAMLTGYYAQQVNRDALPSDSGGGHGKRPSWAKLLPERLAALGYRSYHVGKWHLDGGYLASGWNRSYANEDSDRHFRPQWHALDDQPLEPVRAGDAYYSSDAIADYAITFLKEHAAEHADQPFFAYLAFLAPHFPLQAPAEDIQRYRAVYAAGWDEIRRQRADRLQGELKIAAELGPMEPRIGPPYNFPDVMRTFGAKEINHESPWDDLTEQQQAWQVEKMAVHAAMVDRMDQQIGRVLEQLRAMDALDNTVILVLSDNGASAEMMLRGDGHDPLSEPGAAESYVCLGPGWSRAANTPFRRHKTWVHEGGIASPLIVHWPRNCRAQRTADRRRARRRPDADAGEAGGRAVAAGGTRGVSARIAGRGPCADVCRRRIAGAGRVVVVPRRQPRPAARGLEDCCRRRR